MGWRDTMIELSLATRRTLQGRRELRWWMVMLVDARRGWIWREGDHIDGKQVQADHDHFGWRSSCQIMALKFKTILQSVTL
jgi:hypothetical protein